MTRKRSVSYYNNVPLPSYMMANIITLGIKNKPVCFVLPSFFRNFANGLANFLD